jgi:hypothetical protein
VRPGCLHLTVDVLLPHDAAQLSHAGGARAVARRLLCGRHGNFWSQQLLQVRVVSQQAAVLVVTMTCS